MCCFVSFLFFVFLLLGFYFFIFLFVYFLFFIAFQGCFSLGTDWDFSSLFCFLNLSSKQTYDSWWLGHVVTDDLLIDDIGDQALDIVLHGPESAHKNGIVKKFTHTSIHNQPCTLLKQTAKHSTHQTWHLRSVVFFLSNVAEGSSQEPWQKLLSTAPTSEVFSPRTVLTEDICSCVQQIIEHSLPSMPFLTTPTITLSWLGSAATQPDSWWRRGAWWCRYRGHSRTGPRHLSPRSRVCAQEWHSEDIHAQIHYHPHFSKTNTKRKNLQLTRHDAFV